MSATTHRRPGLSRPAPDSAGKYFSDVRANPVVEVVTGGEQPGQHSALNHQGPEQQAHGHVVVGPVHDLDRVAGADVPGRTTRR